MRCIRFSLILLGLLVPGAAASDAVSSFRQWLKEYRAGRIDLHQPTAVAIPSGDPALGGRYFKTDAIDHLIVLLKGMVDDGSVDAARLLVDAASWQKDRSAEVELEKRTSQQPWIVRRLAAEALDSFTSAEVGEWLAQTPARDFSAIDGARRRAVAASALANGHHENALSALEALLGDDVVAVRRAAVTGLGTLGDATVLPHLVRATTDIDPKVRLEALVALDSLSTTTDDDDLEGERLKRLIAALSDPDPSIRYSAARLLAKPPQRDAIPPLVAALAEEQRDMKRNSRRVRAAIRDTLAELTGEDFPSYRPDDWADWWDSVADDFEIDATTVERVVPEQGARFFGIPVEADVVVFALDTSGSMRKPAFRGSAGPTRLFVAVRELKRCIEALEPGTQFNLVLFNDQITPFASAPVTKDADTLAKIESFVDAIEPSGGTNLYSALDFALGESDLNRRLLGDEIDTLILLTDGTPSSGPILMPEEIRSQISSANQGRRVTIHTICAGSEPSRFLRELARENGGIAQNIDS